MPVGPHDSTKSGGTQKGRRIARRLAVLCVLCMGSPALAAEPAASSPAEEPDAADFDGYSDRWTGAFYGAAVLFGPSWVTGDVGAEGAFSVGATLRASSVLSLVDGQLEYRWVEHDGHDDVGPAPSGATWALSRHIVSASVNLHPAFLTNFGGDRLWYTVAAIYLQGGLAMAFDELRLANRSARDMSAHVHLGVGLDAPMTDPEVGGALWVGVLYRLAFADAPLAPLEGSDIREHVLLLQVSYRHNGLPW